VSQTCCTIETGTPGDIETIARFQVAMAAETEDYALDPETVDKGVRRMFAEPERGFYLLAKNTGETVGGLLVLKEWSDWRNADVWWIHSLYVVPEHRRRGVFRRLMGEVERLAREAGAAGLRLYVERTNDTAKAVYSVLGMTGEHYELFEKMF